MRALAEGCPGFESVAALYVCTRGPYPELVRHWFDEARDAATYAGPHPVVAHPPCGPWGRLRHLCTKQNQATGFHAVDMVRRFGGVLEHPRGSLLFDVCRMPRPGGPVDLYGGMTYELRQLWWGHCCEKPTWIYVVGVDPRFVRAQILAMQNRCGWGPSRRVTSGIRGPKLPSATIDQRTHTPPAFAMFLISLADRARVTRDD